MKKFEFFKEIIKSDFSIAPANKIKNRFSNQKIVVKKQAFEVLNLIQLNKNLKQFLNSLYNLKKYEGTITILVSDSYICALLINLVKDAGLANNIFVFNASMYIQSLTTYHMLILLDTTFFTNNNFLPRIFEKKISIIHTFNTVKELKSQGLYKIFNEITDLKKILFFFLLIKTVLLLTVKVSKSKPKIIKKKNKTYNWKKNKKWY